MLCTCCGEEADLQTTTCAGCGARFRRNTLGIVAGIALLAAALREGQPLWLSLMMALIAVRSVPSRASDGKIRRISARPSEPTALSASGPV